jgi:hypothetical protein
MSPVLRGACAPGGVGIFVLDEAKAGLITERCNPNDLRRVRGGWGSGQRDLQFEEVADPDGAVAGNPHAAAAEVQSPANRLVAT